MNVRYSVLGVRSRRQRGKAPLLSGCFRHGIPKTQHRRPNTGFTLIEMITILIIIAIMSSLTVPYYARFRDRADFDRSVSILEGELNNARHSAIQTGADCVVRFDPQIDVFTIAVEVPEAQSDTPAAMQDQPDALRIPPPKSVNIGDNIGVQEFRPLINHDSQSNDTTENRAMTEMRFHEDGSSDGGTITLISPHGFAAQIQITPQSGAVRVQQDNERPR